MLAWAVCRWFGRDQPKDSIWFGERTFDGLLFPLLALLLTDLARRAVLEFQPVLVLRMAVSVFLSLAAIRLFARVLRAVFPASAVVRLIERTISWMAWIAAVLWIVGLLPAGAGRTRRASRWPSARPASACAPSSKASLSAGVVLVIALWISSTIEKRILRTR